MVSIDHGENQNVGTGVDSFFTNSDLVACPYTKCVLKNNISGNECTKSDPTLTLDLYTGPLFKIGEESPFQVTAHAQDSNSFYEPICVVCQSGEDFVNWSGHIKMSS